MSKEVIAAVDIETEDPFLSTYGPGAIRGFGRILTVAIYCPDYDIDGYWSWEDFLEDEEAVTLLADPDVRKIFHNGQYDREWLEIWGKLEVVNCDDTMTRETLLDAYADSYSLDNCCIRHGLEGKNRADTIEKWWTEHGGKGKVMQHLSEIPVDIVGRYNLQDCHATYSLYQWQQPQLEEQNLIYCNGIERKQVVWVLMCKKAGIRIDNNALKEFSASLHEELSKQQHSFKETYGDYNYRSTNSLKQLFEAHGWHVPTKMGKACFDKDKLLAVSEAGNSVGQAILDLRHTDKMLNTFVDRQFVELQWNGRLYPEFHPAKRDGAGALTGRYSSSMPNFQNVPARDGDKRSRALFIPEDGCVMCAFDYKQIEYRIFSHFAEGEGADELRAKYWELESRGETLDYHTNLQKMLNWYFEDDKEKTKIFRGITKNIAFGTLYGLGFKAMAQHYSKPMRQAHPDYEGSMVDLCKSIVLEVHKRAPFMDTTVREIRKWAQRRGYVKTVSGRRQRQPPAMPNGDIPWYVLTNYLCQGSAGDVVKKAIADSTDAGLWKVLTPHGMVHDEIVFSAPLSSEGYEACLWLKEIMVHAYDLRVPLGVDTEIGPDWGHCTEENWNEYEAKYGSDDIRKRVYAKFAKYHQSDVR